VPQQPRPRSQPKWRPVPQLRGSLLALALAVGPAVGVIAQTSADVKGSRDHPMISRIDGSRIKRFEQKELDEYRLVKGSLPGFDEEGARLPNTEAALNDEDSIRLEGRVWRLTYELPNNRSTLEVIKSYQTELANAGFKTLFSARILSAAVHSPRSARDPGSTMASPSTRTRLTSSQRPVRLCPRLPRCSSRMPS
jgi:hypothetical protein